MFKIGKSFEKKNSQKYHWKKFIIVEEENIFILLLKKLYMNLKEKMNFFEKLKVFMKII